MYPPAPARRLSPEEPLHPRISQIVKSLGDPVADVMNEIKQRRLDAGLPVVDFNQGLIRAPESLDALVRKWSAKAELTTRVSSMSQVRGYAPLRASIAAWRQILFREEIGEENVLITAGGNSALDGVLPALTDPGDPTVLTRPYFFNHHDLVQIAGRQRFFADLDFGNEEACLRTRGPEMIRTTGCRMFLISNPNNPTGIQFSRDTMNLLEAACGSQSAALVMDESYGPSRLKDEQFATTGHPLSLTTTVVTGSFTKSLGLADLRLGYVIAHSKIIDALRKVADSKWLTTSQVDQKVAVEALLRRDDIQVELETHVTRNRGLIDDWAQTCPEIAVCPGRHGVFAWIQLPQGVNDEALVHRLAIECGVITTPGSSYGMPGFIRLAYGMASSPEEIMAGLRQIIETIRATGPSLPNLDSFAIH